MPGPTESSGSQWVWVSSEILFSFPSLKSDHHTQCYSKEEVCIKPPDSPAKKPPSLPQNDIFRCSTLRMDDFTEWLFYNFQLDPKARWFQTPSSEGRKVTGEGS